MIFDPEVETRSVDEQYAIDSKRFPEQIKYLFKNSPFYNEKLIDAGFSSFKDIQSDR